MACINCSSPSPLTFDVQLFYSNQCFSPCTTGCGNTVTSSACVQYLGPNLSCSGILTNDSLEVALQKIDTQICSAIGDYSTYQFNCLPTWLGSAIITEAEFVEAITGYTCQTRTNLDDFLNVDFPAYQAAVTVLLNNVDVPGITCSIAGITNTDTIAQALTKYCTAITEIEDDIDISSVTWNDCFTVVSPPATIAAGFQLLSDQICSVKASSSTLPTFNNTANCLVGGATDSLVSTVGQIITRLCILPKLNNASLTSSCITIPAPAADLQTLLQNMLNKMDILIQAYPTYSADFHITANGAPCNGINVALTTPINQDRLVAVSYADLAPGTLVTKITSTGGSLTITNVANTTLDLELANGNKGDIVVSGGGTVFTIGDDAVTYDKIQDVNTQKLLGRSTAGVGEIEEIAIGSNLILSGGVLAGSGRTLLAITAFSSSGTWTKNANTTSVIVECIGAGGGSGGVTGAGANAAAGGGGGGGAYVMSYITSGLLATETVTVGTGGAAGSNAGGNGGNGGNTSFGTHLSAEGGKGGTGMVAGTASAAAPGGLSGVVLTFSGTSLAGGGSAGDPGIRISGTFAYAGNGGNSKNGGRGGQNTVSGVGISSGSSGGGGTGSLSMDGAAYAGCSGLGGYVVVYEYS